MSTFRRQTLLADEGAHGQCFDRAREVSAKARKARGGGPSPKRARMVPCMSDALWRSAGRPLQNGGIRRNGAGEHPAENDQERAARFRIGQLLR
jgi:hypothetical protein